MTISSGGAYPDDLKRSIEALSRLRVAEEDVSSTVDRIAHLAVAAIGGAESCSISFARKRKVTTVASTSDVGEQVDVIQYEAKEGPCLSSIDRLATFHIQDMSSDDTWPVFSKRITQETPVRSMLAYVLKVDNGAVAALNLTSSSTDSFTEEDIAVGALFATQAGVAFANALTHESDTEQIRQLEESMKTRQLIGQAVGLLMATEGVDADAAFSMLTNISQRSNIKIRELAERMIAEASGRPRGPGS